jgi:hypothetical protein
VLSSSSNFSLGVNIFFEINEYLAKMMAKLTITVLKWKKFTILKNWMLHGTASH